MQFFDTLSRRLGTPGTVIATALFAVVINLVIYGIGTVVGGTFDFTDGGERYHVNMLTLTGFTAIPLLVGLTVVAILARWVTWVFPVAPVVAPIAAIGTIFSMTIPADLDTTSTVTLAVAHVMVGLMAINGILALRSATTEREIRIVRSAHAK